MSKGSGRRPQEADDKHVSSEWDRLFKKQIEESGSGESFQKVSGKILNDRYEKHLNDSKQRR